MDYIKNILNKLLDRADNSKKNKDSITPIRTISLNVEKDKIFEKYWAEDSYKYRPDIEDAVNSLVKQGFITAEYDRFNELLKKVVLNNQNIASAYVFLERTPKSVAVSNDIKRANTLLSTLNNGTVAYKYLSAMIELLLKDAPHLSYFKSCEELLLLSEMVNEIENNEEEILLRNFSKKKFKDSKLVERNSNKLLHIFNEFDNRKYTDFSELCSLYYIVKNKGYAYIKQGICFKINSQIIDLDALGTDFALSDEAIDRMEILSLNKNKVVTIENLTTFHYYNATDSIIIYLGGYHNSVKRNLLQKIDGFNKQLSWYHMGDIDWGGFEIFIHLKNMTGINFMPLNMGIEQLTMYKNECIALTENDRHKLNLLFQNPDARIFYPIIEFMLKNGYKLEQESLDF